MGAGGAVRAGLTVTGWGWRRMGWLAVLTGLVLGAAAPVPGQAGAVVVPAGCGVAVVGEISCGVSVSAPAAAAAAGAAGSLPPGLGPADLKAAYGLSSSSVTGGFGQTVAVVTAYGDTSAETDMATYRSAFSLPACGSGCFSVVDENGGTSYPASAPGWSAATAQSLDMISAVCPHCHILLVEAGLTNSAGVTTAALADLGTAENTAVRLGAKFVVNTWFTPEASFSTGEPALDSQYFDHPGVAITAPDGNDAGYGTYYPAASPDVIAVGGTTLTRDSSSPRGWDETVFAGTGSGCSPYEAKPSWQADTSCPGRMLNDVAAVADPGSGMAFYDTGTEGGWADGGGGDVAAALVGAAYALAGAPAASSFPASYLYAHDGAGQVNDITSGSNGTCTPAYFCTAGPGYDGPSGVGTPASVSALGAVAPQAGPAGGPAVTDPVDGSLNVFGVGTANGTVWRDSRTSSGTWSGWKSMGGTLKADPLSAVFDPASGNLEVYGLDSAGGVVQDASVNGTWSGWKSMGGTFGSPPSAAFDPLDNALDVWVAGTNGTVFENSWTAGGGWSGWKNKGGVLSTAGLDVAYDPVHAIMQVFGTGNGNGTVWGGSYTPAGGFSGWQNMGGQVTGAVSAVFDPLSGGVEVYGDESGHAEETSSSDGGATWSAWHELNGQGPTLGHPPAAIYSSAASSVQVWEAGVPQGTGFDSSWTPAGGWSAWQNRGGALGSVLFPVYDPGSGDLQVFGVGANGTVWGGSLTPAGVFSGWQNLGGTLQTGDL